MKIAFYTLGCRLNQAETDSYQESLAMTGFNIVDINKKYDIAVINTCSVTHKADRESRQIIRKLKKQQPQAIIIMTGCSAFEIPEIDYYIKDKENFIDELLKIFLSSGKQKIFELNKTRANIKIQTGCDNYCTYCITTYRRGKARSFDSKKIIEQINKKHKQGYKEIVLTGVNIGQYKFGKLDLVGLINKILKNTKIKRIRLSSINPDFVYKNEKFFKLFKDPRLCQHLHLSLQSGSDAVLKKMNRLYTVKQYLEIVNKYYRVYPLFGFTTDVIVGFPGETEKYFQESCKLVEECRFLKIHVFRYSIREGTAAAKMPEQVDEKIKKQRAEKMRNINTRLQKVFAKKMKGQKLEVLFESKRGEDWIGYAGNYYLVKYNTKKDLDNKIVKLEID